MNKISREDTYATSDTPAFICHHPRPNAKLRLYCFHHAGGTPAVFRTWAENLPETIEVVAGVLPGRGARSSHERLCSMEALLSDIGPALQQHRDRPMAFFGHSMGALVVYELTRWLRQFGLEAPRHLIVAGFPAPQQLNIERGRVLHTLPAPELIATLRQLNGIPKQLLDEPTLLDQALPNFRSDIELVERYAHVEQAPLSLPLLTLGGLDDIVGVVRLRGWEACSDGAFALRMFKGGHFFLKPNLAAIGSLIGSLLS